MNDEQVSRIVLAIREHTRAMVAAYIAFTPPDTWPCRDDMLRVSRNSADALLAELSASTPLPRASMEETVLRATERIEADLLRDRRAELSASSGGENDAEGQHIRGSRPIGMTGEASATPPLPADLVAARARIAELEAQVERMRLALEWAHEREGTACACGEAGEHPEDCPVANALAHPLIGGAK